MKKKLLIAGCVLIVVGAAVMVFGWFWISRPMYAPGTVRSASLEVPAQPAEESYWTVQKDIRLFHFSEGSGRNVLVVHGGPGYPIRDAWPGFKPLTSAYKFSYYDQRGCGKSTRPIDRFTSSNYYGNVKTLERTLGLGAQIADIERIRRILGDEKLILVGHSFGGFLASLYAAEFPERVKGLILVAPAVVLVMPSSDGGLFEEIRPLLPATMQQDYAAYLKRYFDYGGIFSRSEAELQSLNAEIGKYYAAAMQAKGLAVPPEGQIHENGGWMVQAMYFSMGRRHDFRGALKNAGAPVLVIHGAKDLQTERESRAYTESFPNSRFAVIGNASHFPFTEQPEEFATLAGKFLNELK